MGVVEVVKVTAATRCGVSIMTTNWRDIRVKFDVQEMERVAVESLQSEDAGTRKWTS